MTAPQPETSRDPAPPRPAAPAPAPDAAPRGATALAWTSLVLGIFGILGSVNLFLADPATIVVCAVLAASGLATGIIAVVRMRRRSRSATGIGIAGLVVSAIALVLACLGALQFALLFVFAERLESPEPTRSSAEVAAEQAATEREYRAVAGAAADRLEAVRLPDGTYPTRLAVTTDQQQLITPDGEVIAELPFDTEVGYTVYMDATTYELRLFGPNGTRAVVDSHDGITVEHVEYADW
ncbi:hypothetical protein J2X63_002050 [Agromyces sp. 3263]|uniref:hypothetical protein n=1 Tax=Agromyces sp. 3263 TaxID=2817750 RepID=UPI00285FBD0A|nr:hypothetical protein [Agromyces sp. 3263]MDR6906364.1 hypothetical protein [Agromyces sp. 3263]